MAPIRAIRPAAAAALPPFKDWRNGHLHITENYGDLAKVPWAKLRAVEIFPGSRLDADKLVVPELWMPAGTLRRPSARTFTPTNAGVPAAAEMAARRDECVRRALYALFLPGNTERGITENKPSTFRARASAFLRLAAWQFENRPSADGSVFGSLTLADLLAGFYPAVAKTEGARASYAPMLRALLDAGLRDVISDYPKFFADPMQAAEFEPVRRNASVLQPAEPAAEPTVEPFPDDFVTEFVRRATWIQENIADGLIEHMARDIDIRDQYVRDGHDLRDDVVMRARVAALSDGRWTGAQGTQITRLPFPVKQFRDEMSDIWPPKDMVSFMMNLSVLQGVNLGVVNLCTGARSSEVLAADDEPFGERSGRYNSVTFKMVDELGGKPRDWPLHPIAELAIDKQRKLSVLVRPEGEKQLWVALKDKRGSRLTSASAVFARAVEFLGLNHLVGNGTAHMHRWRHTVARLVALSVVGAPKVLLDLFGHQNIDMTVHYMMSSPDIADEAMRVAKETTYAMVENAILETVEGKTGGAAAQSLRDNLPKAMRRSEDAYDTKTLRETVEVLTFEGDYWALVREGVICTKGLGQFGPCTKGRGTPDPGACRTSCEHRLELAVAQQQCEETLTALIRERKSALADEREMLVERFDGQIVAELKRWDEVRRRVLAGNPELQPIWDKSSKGIPPK